MKKEKVLEIEFVPVFDGWAWRIVYQDEEILERGEFKDEEIGVFSRGELFYDRLNNKLFIRGIFKEGDDYIKVCTTEEKAIIEEKVRLINEKYGKPKRWRAKYKEKFFFIDTRVAPSIDYDYRTPLDNIIYENGNYFQTKEEAERVTEEIRKVFERAKKGEFKNVEM